MRRKGEEWDKDMEAAKKGRGGKYQGAGNLKTRAVLFLEQTPLGELFEFLQTINQNVRISRKKCDLSHFTGYLLVGIIR